MPNKDGTGPDGKGPRTGKQKGNCVGERGSQQGAGKGCCRGHGRANGGCRRQ